MMCERLRMQQEQMATTKTNIRHAASPSANKGTHFRVGDTMVKPTVSHHYRQRLALTRLWMMTISSTDFPHFPSIIPIRLCFFHFQHDNHRHNSRREVNSREREFVLFCHRRAPMVTRNSFDCSHCAQNSVTVFVALRIPQWSSIARRRENFTSNMQN